MYQTKNVVIYLHFLSMQFYCLVLKTNYSLVVFWSRDTGTYDGAYIGSVFLTFSKGFIVYFDNSFGCSFGCITVSETLVFFQLNNIFESQN